MHNIIHQELQTDTMIAWMLTQREHAQKIISPIASQLIVAVNLVD